MKLEREGTVEGCREKGGGGREVGRRTEVIGLIGGGATGLAVDRGRNRAWI